MQKSNILQNCIIISSYLEDIQFQGKNMVSLEFGNKVGVLSENAKYRLDIGTQAMKVNVPASHDSWATRLKLKRLDGPNSGPIDSGHVIGVFSENGKYRLDIGTQATKVNVPVSHDSWATRLKLKRLDGPNSGPIHYGHIIGVFSEDGKYRLDIGTKAMKVSVPASHNSWATRLVIKKIEHIKVPKASIVLPITASRGASTWVIDKNGVVSSHIRYTVGAAPGSKHYATGIVVEFADDSVHTAIATATIGRPLHGTTKGTKSNHAHAAIPLNKVSQISRVYVKYEEPSSSGPGTIKGWVDKVIGWAKEADKIYKELKDTDLVSDAITYL